MGTRIGLFELRLHLNSLLIFIGVAGVGAFGEAQKYLIVSSPSTSSVAYLTLSSSGAPASGEQPMKTLIDSGLTFPQGLAIDQFRRTLLVADPQLGKLISYKLRNYYDELRADSMKVVANGVEVRSVAVDGLGNIFFTEEPSHRIMRVTAMMQEKGITVAETVYDGAQVPSVSAPGGIAADNFFVYWLNKAAGTEVGTLIRARQQAPANSSADGNVLSLANNANKCYGLCVALGNIFYTDEQNNLYGVPRASTARHEPVTVSAALQEPRGCAFDGDGTVYVADKQLHAVYQFPSNMQQPTEHRPLKKAAELQGAFGVALYVRVG